MIRLNCDYLEGCHPAILEALARTNMEQHPGYGEDAICDEARARIREACQAPEADVHFLVGGTQANTTVISAILRPHQGVLSADTGHIAVHETGAIEATGHKVLALPSPDGKVTAKQVRDYVAAHYADASFEHMPQPGMVYISHPTESGTIYSKAELTELSRTCRELGLPLFMDGARMGYGLCCAAADLTLADIAGLCDVFYIGGTKVGALFGEAVVITDKKLGKDFRYHIKQRGGMLAKGRLLGIQFLTLFTDDLYFRIAKQAADLALRLRAGLEELGCSFLIDSPTNQQFPILPDTVLDKLAENYAFSLWQKMGDGTSCVRFCVSWATTPEQIESLLRDLKKLMA